MQQFANEETPTGPSSAGLVLLFAEPFLSLPPAWPLAPDGVTLGRDEAADVYLPVPAVSRVHAKISHERAGWSISDQGSTNGVLVDGYRVTDARIEHGAEIRIGDAILKFVSHEAPDYARYRIDGELIGAQRRSNDLAQLSGGYQMDCIRAELARIGPTELSVILLGESGTGKEVVSRELHRLSGRRGQFCAVNCAAIPDNLLESELFGYKRGAFSGADRDKPGLIQAAHQGTLLLDEIGDMPVHAQAKLLRVLQSKEVYPVGATAPDRVDVRVVCATHRDLSSLQRQGKFREDLFARLNEYQLHLPPLRDRKEDIYLLVQTFLRRHGRAQLKPDFQYMTGLLHYDWPYNVRELEASVKRAIALAEGDVLTARHLPAPLHEHMVDYGRSAAAELGTAPAERGTPTEEDLRALLHLHRGNIAAVGRDLGKARMQVHRWLKRYAIELEDYR